MSLRSRGSQCGSQYVVLQELMAGIAPTTAHAALAEAAVPAAARHKHEQAQFRQHLRKQSLTDKAP
jgi:hypothetical protein